MDQDQFESLKQAMATRSITGATDKAALGDGEDFARMEASLLWRSSAGAGYERDTSNVLWENYVADFFSGLHLADELEGDERRMVDIEIVPQQHLDKVAAMNTAS